MNGDESKYPEVLADLRESLTAALMKKGIKTSLALQCAHEAAETIRREWGGTSVYICKGLDYELSRRDLEIWSNFSGHNHRQLCKKYNITNVWLYKIIKKQRSEMIKTSQGDLFEPKKEA